MLFLSGNEKKRWAELAEQVLTGDLSPASYGDGIRPNLLPAFYFYIGTLLASKGRCTRGIEWLEAATLIEDDSLFLSAFLLGFLGRQDGQFVMPARAFDDPRHFIHFASVPLMKEAREQFIVQCGHTLPSFHENLRIMDIGCGDGSLTVRLLRHLQDTGKAAEIEEILLIDPSPAMIRLAEETVREAYPESKITTMSGQFQDVSGAIDRHFDVAVSSLAYHHMPYEQKQMHLQHLKPWIDHFLLFELDANNDTPVLDSPDLALSVYQSYGRIIDFVFSHDAPVEVATGCVDCFLMTELVSLMTQPRRIRTEYHMLESQWNDLFQTCLGPDFTLLCDSACYADEYVSLFTMHYGRMG